MACSLNTLAKPMLHLPTPTLLSGHNAKLISVLFRHTLHMQRRREFVASVLAPPLSTSALETAASYNPNAFSLPDLWKEMQGCNNWEDLLNPLHPLLRYEIIRYGEFVSACYQAFDQNLNSKRYLSCKHGKRSLLREVGLENSGYKVTKYIYATPDVNLPVGGSCGRWIGYVAVSSDDEVKKIGRRDILIALRGTVTNQEWMVILMSFLTPARLDPQNPRLDIKVESGFLNLYTTDESITSKFGVTSCREQLLSEVSRLLNVYKGEQMSITLAGHSMGSSLALLFAYDISELGLLNCDISINSSNNNGDSSDRDNKIPITIFSFGGPRVGNAAFKERCEELGVKVLRIVNVNDPITKVPGVFLNESIRVLGGRYKLPWSCSCYAHVGAELALDFFDAENPSWVHHIDSYIDFLKYPDSKSSPVVIQSGLDNLIAKACDFVLMRVENFDML